MCPNCEEGELQYRCLEWVEPHGEQCSQVWYECLACSEVFGEQELRRLEDDEEKGTNEFYEFCCLG